jgi:peptide/nickel transport system substrate-binding protein
MNKFKDIRIRQALNHAINRQEILDIVADGKGTILGSALYSGFGRYYNGELANYYAYDVNKAKELIKEVLGDEKLSFTVKVPSNYEVHMSTALVIREQLKKADIEMTIDAVDWNTWLTEVYVGGNYETTIIGFDSLLAPKDMMRRYATNGSGNMTKFSDEEYDKLYLEALATTDDAKKIELYKKMQEIVTKKAASVFIQDNAVLLAINKKLKGYVFYPIYVQDMSVLYFE